MKTLGQRLKWAREAAGLSTRELDARARLTPGHTNAIESGRRLDPSTSTTRALAHALDISLDWLVDGEGPTPNERKLRATGS